MLIYIALYLICICFNCLSFSTDFRKKNTFLNDIFRISIGHLSGRTNCKLTLNLTYRQQEGHINEAALVVDFCVMTALFLCICTWGNTFSVCFNFLFCFVCLLLAYETIMQINHNFDYYKDLPVWAWYGGWTLDCVEERAATGCAKHNPDDLWSSLCPIKVQNPHRDSAALEAPVADEHGSDKGTK